MIDKIKSPVRILSAIRFLEKNQYTFDVDPNTTKTEVKHWIETFFKVKVVGMNSHRPPSKVKRMGSTTRHAVCYKRMIVTIRSGESITIF